MNIPLNIVHIFNRFNVVVAGKKYLKELHKARAMEEGRGLMTTVHDKNSLGKL